MFYPLGCSAVFIDEFIRNGLKPKNVLIWDKKSHSMGDLKKAFGGRYESIIWIPNDDFKFKNRRPQDLISVPRVPPCKLIHPNEKPVELLEFLIKKTTSQNATVLDCFMGSGSTGVACVNTNRNFIGMELDEHYFEIAKKRINEVIYNESQHHRMGESRRSQSIKNSCSDSSGNYRYYCCDE